MLRGSRVRVNLSPSRTRSYTASSLLGGMRLSSIRDYMTSSDLCQALLLRVGKSRSVRTRLLVIEAAQDGLQTHPRSSMSLKRTPNYLLALGRSLKKSVCYTIPGGKVKPPPAADTFCVPHVRSGYVSFAFRKTSSTEFSLELSTDAGRL